MATKHATLPLPKIGEPPVRLFVGLVANDPKLYDLNIIKKIEKGGPVFIDTKSTTIACTDDLTIGQLFMKLKAMAKRDPRTGTGKAPHRAAKPTGNRSGGKKGRKPHA